MRAFIALTLDERFLSDLWLLTSASRAKTEPAFRWTQRNNLHLTIKFLGEITQAQCASVKDALKSLPPLQLPSAKIKDAGFFPDVRRPRIYKLEFETNESILNLVRSIESITTANSIPREARPFRPHLTLARIKDLHPFPPLQLISQMNREIQSLGETSFTNLTFYESRLTPKGPVYTSLSSLKVESLV